MANVCSNCGEQNAPDAQFCVSCRSTWDGGTERRDAGPPGTVGPGSGPSGPRRTHLRGRLRRSVRRAGRVRREGTVRGRHRDLRTSSLTLDGAPATVTVTVANTSTLVDSYLRSTQRRGWKVTPGTARLPPASSGTVAAQLRVVAQTLVPAQTLTLVVRVSNNTGGSTYRDLPVTVTVPVVTAPIGVRAEPQTLRVRDTAPGVPGGRQQRRDEPVGIRWPLRRRPRAGRPGHVGSAQVQVRREPRRRSRSADAPRPSRAGGDPHHHRHRPRRTAPCGTTLTLNQSASHAAIELLETGSSPASCGSAARRRGRMTTARRRQPPRHHARRRGVDCPGPPSGLRFQITPGSMTVPPGQAAAAAVSVTAPDTSRPGGDRSLTVTATDGQSDISTEGRVIQLASRAAGSCASS